MDQSGKSYYGESSVLFLCLEKNQTAPAIILKKEGPVFDACWHPSGKRFAVVYGRKDPPSSLYFYFYFYF